MTGKYNTCNFNFLKKYQIIFHSSHSIFHLHQQFMSFNSSTSLVVLDMASIFKLIILIDLSA